MSLDVCWSYGYLRVLETCGVYVLCITIIKCICLNMDGGNIVKHVHSKMCTYELILKIHDRLRIRMLYAI